MESSGAARLYILVVQEETRRPVEKLTKKEIAIIVCCLEGTLASGGSSALDKLLGAKGTSTDHACVAVSRLTKKLNPKTQVVCPDCRNYVARRLT